MEQTARLGIVAASREALVRALGAIACAADEHPELPFGILIRGGQITVFMTAENMAVVEHLGAEFLAFDASTTIERLEGELP